MGDTSILILWWPAITLSFHFRQESMWKMPSHSRVELGFVSRPALHWSNYEDMLFAFQNLIFHRVRVHTIFSLPIHFLIFCNMHFIWSILTFPFVSLIVTRGVAPRKRGVGNLSLVRYTYVQVMSFFAVVYDFPSFVL